jgi:deoxyadenosine/deoxycytidine kinase
MSSNIFYNKRRSRMKRIGVIGTIGVGKSTFLEKLSEKFNKLGELTITYGEPSIIHGDLNDILRKFYKNTKRWAYSLQSGVSAAHDGIYTDIRELEEDGSEYRVAIVDAPYSSFIYCNIHAKAGRITEEERIAIDNLSRPFYFDYIILLEESADETIERIMHRNRNLELGDLSYMYEHIEDFKLFRKQYLERYFPDSKFIHLKGLPDLSSPNYNELINNIATMIMQDEGEKYNGEEF